VSIIDTVHAFTHEIIDLVVLPDGSLVVLTQDGQCVKLDGDGKRLMALDFPGQCAWDVQAVPGNSAERTYRLGTDTGVQTIALHDSLNGPLPMVVQDWRLDRGFVRSLACTEQDTYCVTHGRDVLRLDCDGKVVWSQSFASRLHTVAVNPAGTSVLVAANEGAWELEADTGRRRATFDVGGRDAWVTTYLLSGERVVATHDFDIHAFSAVGEDLLWSLKLDGYAKRMRATEDALWVTGGGGVRQIDLVTHQVVRHFDELLENTVENFARVGPFVYAISYGCQLAAYDYDTCQALGLIENLPDFPKALVAVDVGHGQGRLLLGGRGGFLETRRVVDDGTPALLRTSYLPT